MCFKGRWKFLLLLMAKGVIILHLKCLSDGRAAPKTSSPQTFPASELGPFLKPLEPTIMVTSHSDWTVMQRWERNAVLHTSTLWLPSRKDCLILALFMMAVLYPTFKCSCRLSSRRGVILWEPSIPSTGYSTALRKFWSTKDWWAAMDLDPAAVSWAHYKKGRRPLQNFLSG